MKNALWVIVLVAALVAGCGGEAEPETGNGGPADDPQPATRLLGEAQKLLAALVSATDEASGEAALTQVGEIAAQVEALKNEGATLDAAAAKDLKAEMMSQLRRLSGSHGKLSIEANKVRKAIGL